MAASGELAGTAVEDPAHREARFAQKSHMYLQVVYRKPLKRAFCAAAPCRGSYDRSRHSFNSPCSLVPHQESFAPTCFAP